MIKNFSKKRIVWTKHASKEVLEDNFDPTLIEKHLDKTAEFPEFNEDKKRGIIKIDGRYCTLIYVEMKFGLKIITCWESNRMDIMNYRKAIREYKDK